MQDKDRKAETRQRLGDSSRIVLAAALLLSFVIHFSSYIQLGHIKGKQQAPKPLAQKDGIRLKFHKTKPLEKTLPPPTVKNEEEALPILETPLEKTERPEVVSRSGEQDHIAKKETKVLPKPEDNMLDPGKKGTNTDAIPKPFSPQKELAQPNAEVNRDGKPAEQQDPKYDPRNPSNAEPQPTVADKAKSGRESNPNLSLSVGSLKFDTKPAAPPRNSYEKLLAFSSSELSGQVNAGFQDYIEEDLEIGDAIDLNTQEYRFIGYFSEFRKALALVWNYPIEAVRRGMQGQVGLLFAFNENGSVTRIKVTRSSGYPILDNAIVDAIKLASPFSPLPKGIAKKKLVVRGSFTYSLSH